MSQNNKTTQKMAPVKDLAEQTTKVYIRKDTDEDLTDCAALADRSRALVQCLRERIGSSYMNPESPLMKCILGVERALGEASAEEVA